MVSGFLLRHGTSYHGRPAPGEGKSDRLAEIGTRSVTWNHGTPARYQDRAARGKKDRRTRPGHRCVRASSWVLAYLAASPSPSSEISKKWTPSQRSGRNQTATIVHDCTTYSRWSAAQRHMSNLAMSWSRPVDIPAMICHGSEGALGRGGAGAGGGGLDPGASG